jgi:hypothetical protein
MAAVTIPERTPERNETNNAKATGHPWMMSMVATAAPVATDPSQVRSAKSSMRKEIKIPMTMTEKTKPSTKIPSIMYYPSNRKTAGLVKSGGNRNEPG